MATTNTSYTFSTRFNGRSQPKKENVSIEKKDGKPVAVVVQGQKFPLQQERPNLGRSMFASEPVKTEGPVTHVELAISKNHEMTLWLHKGEGKNAPILPLVAKE